MKTDFRSRADGASRPFVVSAIMIVAGNPVVGADAPDTTKPAGTNRPPADIKLTDKTSEEYRNWFETSVGSTFISGDRASFMRRTGLPKGPFGGVEDFHFERDVGKRGLLQIDGRGIFDNHDYDLRLGLSQPGIGYLRGGYKEFRTYYDGSGGFFPPNQQWISLYNENFSLDRGSAWIEGGLTLPGWPELRAKYSHEFRSGLKDSTSWGDTGLTGLPGPNNIRGIVPTFLGIDEKRDIFEGDIKHTLGKTELGAGVRYEISDQDNSRNIHRRPGEPAFDRFVTQKDGVHADLFSVHGFAERHFGEKFLLTSAYSYTMLDTDISGSRIYGSSYDPVYDPVYARRQFHDEGFLNLSGGSNLKQHVGNLNLMWTPWDHLAIIPSIRVEHEDQDGLAGYTETTVGAPPALLSTQSLLENTRQRGFTDVSEALELRYTGITNWTFYARGEWLEGEGNLAEQESEAQTGLVTRDTDSTRLVQKYVAGANWYPLRKLNFGGQYYFKSRRNDYDNLVDSTPNAPPSADRYPAYILQQDFDTHDMNVRVTWRPLPSLTTITRYDFQLSTIDTRQDFLTKTQGAKSTAHIISETLSWVPWARLYFQGSINYVLDQTDTHAAEAVPGANPVLNAKNDYWNASLLANIVLSEKTDFQPQYLYYRADNYRDNSAFGQPYGAGVEEHGVTAALIHRFTKRLQGTLRYGFFTNHDRTYGSHNDYTAHMVYSSLRYAF